MAGGLICTPISAERANHLNLTRMTSSQDKHGTAFTVSVDAKKGISTGISAPDRARTIQLLSDPESKRSDFCMPGHVFPLISHTQGVLGRPGHTEAATDLAKMGNCQPAAVICEIMNEDGSMARRTDLREFVKKFDLRWCSIKEIIRYRKKTEKLIQKSGSVKLPTRHTLGNFDLHCYVSTIDGQEHIALVLGQVAGREDLLVRVHSECLTGDVFHSARCDCGDQLEIALQRIVDEEAGILIYLRQEGRGIGLINKIRSYHLQEEQGLDTVDANTMLGFPPDLRDYSIAAQILKGLRVGSIRLLTNNPQKLFELQDFNLKVNQRIPIVASPKVHNKYYLKTKKERLGHLL